MTKLKVIMISEYPCSDAEQGRGGILQSTFHLIEGFVFLGAADLDLHLVSQTPGCTAAETRKIGPITIHFVPKRSSELDKFLFNPLRLLAKILQLKFSLRPDLIHGQGSAPAILFSQWLAGQNVQTVHGLYRNENAVIPKEGVSLGRRIRVRITAILENYYLAKIRYLIAITSQVEELVRQLTHGRARIFPTYIAIDPAFFRGRPGSQEPAFRILFVAAMSPRKGLHFLIEAFKTMLQEYPGLQLRAVGMWDWAPDYVAGLQSQYAGLIDSGCLVFTGAVSREQLFEEFFQADIFCLPSLSESAPAVVSQAMCLGLPIVTTAVGGIPEMVSHGETALLVPPADPPALRHALKELIDDAPLRERLGSAARAVALGRYHPKSVAAATLEAYRAAALR